MIYPVVYITGYAGRAFLDAVKTSLAVCVLMTDTINWLMLQPLKGKGLRFHSAVEHFVEYGVNSLPIVALNCFLVGAIMAMQAAYQLERFGASIYIANLVGVAAMRELAPLLSAILVTGRSGSAITAEIGSMKVAEELDALTVMGVNPIKFLVVPKFAAMLFALPCLTILAIFIMIAGGFSLSVLILHLDPDLYLSNTMDALQMKDFAAGMTKSFFFALAICWVGVYRGFQVEGGSESVGRMTTSSVVTSIFFIIVVDLVFTALFFF